VVVDPVTQFRRKCGEQTAMIVLGARDLRTNSWTRRVLEMHSVAARLLQDRESESEVAHN